MKTEKRTIRVTEREYWEACTESLGWCLECGEQSDSCEPDARRYLCEACGARAVYGAEELLMMGRVAFDEDEVRA